MGHNDSQYLSYTLPNTIPLAIFFVMQLYDGNLNLETEAFSINNHVSDLIHLLRNAVAEATSSHSQL